MIQFIPATVESVAEVLLETTEYPAFAASEARGISNPPQYSQSLMLSEASRPRTCTWNESGRAEVGKTVIIVSVRVIARVESALNPSLHHSDDSTAGRQDKPFIRRDFKPSPKPAPGYKDVSLRVVSVSAVPVRL